MVGMPPTHSRAAPLPTLRVRLPDQRDQLVAVMLELLVADAGDVAELVQRRWARGGDAVDGGVMQHHIGRDAAPARHLSTPGAERRDQRRVARAVRALQRREIAAPRFVAGGAVARA